MPEVIVVGAGISGLAAAWRLQQQDVDVVVLEAADRPGGRIHSVEVNGCTVEVGANFITDAYRIIPGLAHEVGAELRPVSDNSAIVVGGRLHSFTASKPFTAIGSGLMPWSAMLSLVPGLGRFAALRRHRGTVDPLDWVDLDEVSAFSWARSLGLRTLFERSWRPAYHGFYFQDAATTSAAGVAAMAAHGLRQKTLTIAGGLSTLTDALAARLDVRLREPVVRIEECATGVAVHTASGVHRAPMVIVAVPGTVLPGIMELDSVQRAVADVPYSTGLLVALGVNRYLHPDELGGAYGVLFEPGGSDLAALAVASRAGHAFGDRDVVTCMFTAEAARALDATPTEEILQAARAHLLTWAPSLADALIDDPAACLVQSIPHAMPMSPPGRLARIAALREEEPCSRILFAGDSVAWPWTDSAAFTGVRAAEMLLARRA